MTDVYAWPPVSTPGWLWDVEDPVARSESMLDGASSSTSAGPRRRIVRLQVSARSNNRRAAGYMAALRRLIAGGQNLVRLRSMPNIPLQEHCRLNAIRGSTRLHWTDGGIDLGWTDGGVELIWFAGDLFDGVAGTDSQGYPNLTVNGFAPGETVALPGEYVAAYSEADSTQAERAMVIAPAVTDETGTVSLRLDQAMAPGSYARVLIGEPETGVFEATNIEPGLHRVAQNWTEFWEFREVLDGERGTLVEKPDWFRG